MLAAHGADAVPICVRRASGREGDPLSHPFGLNALRWMDASLLPQIYREADGWPGVHRIAVHMPGDALGPLAEVLPTQHSAADQAAVIMAMEEIASGGSVDPASAQAVVASLRTRTKSHPTPAATGEPSG